MSPYLSPFTMPDGSVRRPIVERVPECAPKGISVETMEDGAFVTSFIDGEYMPHERVALALCRVACEDWIRSTPCDGYLMLMSIKYAGPRQKVFYSGEVMEERDEDGCEFYGETIHHALNTAAHAVADALGVPH